MQFPVYRCCQEGVSERTAYLETNDHYLPLEARPKVKQSAVVPAGDNKLEMLKSLSHHPSSKHTSDVVSPIMTTL